jgi:hypothetical protein
MKKTLIRLTMAALLSLVLVIAFSTLIIAIAGDSDSKLFRDIFSLFVFSLAFDVALLYINHIRGGKGEDALYDEYAKEKYISPLKDVKKVWENEKQYGIGLAIILGVCFAVNALWLMVLGNERVFILTMIYVSLQSGTSLFPSSSGVILFFLGYVVSGIVAFGLYLLLVTFYRYRVHRKYVKQQKGEI